MGAHAWVECEQQGFICENSTVKSQCICVDSEQCISHFEIHPYETLETAVLYTGNRCLCMRTFCDSIFRDSTTVETCNHQNICNCNLTEIVGCDFNY